VPSGGDSGHASLFGPMDGWGGWRVDPRGAPSAVAPSPQEQSFHARGPSGGPWPGAAPAHPSTGSWPALAPDAQGADVDPGPGWGPAAWAVPGGGGGPGPGPHEESVAWAGHDAGAAPGSGVVAPTIILVFRPAISGFPGPTSRPARDAASPPPPP